MLNFYFKISSQLINSRVTILYLNIPYRITTDSVLNTESKHITQDEDVSLIKACVEKQRKAQKELYEKYYSKLFPISMRYMKDREEAKETTQIAFIKIFNAIEKYDHKGSFAGWMSRITVNTCLDQLRKRSRNFEDGDLSTMPEVGIEPSALSNFSEQDLLNLIQALDDKERMVFSLVEIEGFKHKEVAEILSISEGTSRWYLNQAKKSLKAMIIKSNYDERG
jgi:RNA polymerase sigma-70 factor (ECF subfamily)